MDPEVREGINTESSQLLIPNTDRLGPLHEAASLTPTCQGVLLCTFTKVLGNSTQSAVHFVDK